MWALRNTRVKKQVKQDIKGEIKIKINMVVI